MSDKVEVRTLKGFKDYLPEEQRLRQKIMDTVRTVFELYGFLPLDTPVLEYLEVLTEKYGEDEKLIYNFEDRGGRKVGMRYDLTVPLARVIAQYQNEIKLPFRRYQIGKAWRAESPQKGRFREFMQADADTVGVEDLSADAECVAMYNEVWTRLGIKNFKILINTRKTFDALGELLGVDQEELTEIVRIVDKLDKAGLDRVTEMLEERGLTGDQVSLIQAYLSISEKDNVFNGLEEFFEDSKTGQDALNDLKTIKKYLNNLEVPESVYRFESNIARGLDYYTGTIFETKVEGSSVGSIGSGGRYDGLVEGFLGQKIPAVGISVGIDRVLALFEEQGVESDVQPTKVLIMNMGKEFTSKCLEVLHKLRASNISAEYYYDAKDRGKQFDYAENLSITYAVIIREEEVKGNYITLRDLSTRREKKIMTEDLLTKVK